MCAFVVFDLVSSVLCQETGNLTVQLLVFKLSYLRNDYCYYTTVCLTAFFQDNPGKLAPEG